MYDPHKNVDYAEEADIMGKGRLVKVRFASKPVPNVFWLWIPLGNCAACKYYAPMSVQPDGLPRCLNPKITLTDFVHKYTVSNTCPEFEVGVGAKSAQINIDLLDVMKAISLVPGAPSQSILVIRNEPWSISLSQRAHYEESLFLDMARAADSGNANDPKVHGEYVDLSDDLERPVSPP